MMPKVARLVGMLSITLMLALVNGYVTRGSPFVFDDQWHGQDGLARNLQNPTSTLPAPWIANTPVPTSPSPWSAVIPTSTPPQSWFALSPTPTLPSPWAAASPTPSTGGIAQVEAVVNATSNVNLREGPSTNYNILGITRPGDVLSVLGRNTSASWLYVQTRDGQVAWVYSSLVVLGAGIDNLPVVEAPLLPQPSTAGGSLEIAWMIVGLPTLDEKDAYHTIHIDARGGSGVYTYFWNDQPLDSNTFVLPWVVCGGYIPTTIRVDSSDGQSVKQSIGFNAFCPTPVGCTSCDLWTP